MSSYSFTTDPDVWLRVDIEHYTDVEDQSCVGPSADGDPRSIRGEFGDCWRFEDGSGTPILLYSILVSPVSGGEFNVTLYLDSSCHNKIGTVGPTTSAGLCAFNAIAPNFFQSYSFDHPVCKYHRVQNLMCIKN